ncbi:MAG: bifunctional hydroxymethylpyrimidine kinase/phosphomethylpyrimidine kinase [Burkholderiales bacterium RIFCSPLOWO2_12_FULL_61_40]|nr:MAG: bifunctional hydroxymethylpyrimidine kinase/phosphomethylpyrimidine kinase [Burkholderiales bacterium RIFCSPLOWO2_12_FULL_61_40]
MTLHTFQFAYPRVLTIAGSDSGGGAGIQADLKTFSALGCYGMTAITALTAQNTCGVRSIHAVPPQMLRDQIDAVLDDIGADAVKIGMLHTPEVVHTVAEAIDRHAMKHVVLDPVMASTSGAELTDNPAVELMVRELFPRAAVITPNLDEAALLLGQAIQSAADMEKAARALLAQGAHAVVLKGGHLPGDTVIDVLVGADGEAHWMEAPRIVSPNTHGTGCTLSSAIAAHLALGATLLDAVEQARTYVRGALLAGSVVRTGQGNGPLNHGYAPVVMRLKALG